VWNAWRKRDKEIIPEKKCIILAEIQVGEDEKSKKRTFGMREISFLSRENERNEIWFRAGGISRNHSSIGRGSIESYLALNLDRYESIKVLLRSCWWKITSMDEDSVKNLSARQKLSQWIEMLLISYRDKFQIAWWIEDAIRSVEKRSPRGSINRNLSRICREAFELEKKTVFQRKDKHTKMNAI